MAIAGLVEGIVPASATGIAAALIASGILFVLIDYARILRLRSKMVRSLEPCFCFLLVCWRVSDQVLASRRVAGRI